MPQIAANYIFNSEQPNFARDQVQTMDELFTYGGWNANEEHLTKIDVGHVTFVVEANQHYTYVKINDLDENNNPTGSYHYGWVTFNGAGGGEVSPENPGGGTDPGELGLYTYFKSLVFKRGKVSPAPVKPGTGRVEGQADFGGTFTNPVPYGWSDGIPAVTSEDEKAIWMTTRIFSSGGSSDESQQSEWTAPSMVADTEFRDFEFSSVKDNPGVPQKTNPLDNTDYGDGWSNTASESTVWMAMRDCESGQYKQGSSWDIVKIKGEDGEQALKIKILGRKTSVDELESISDPQYLDAYLIGSDVYVWDGDSWENSGSFKGSYDSTKSWAYLHIKYSDDGRSFTSFGGEVPGKWVGTYCDYNIQDSSNFSDYYWKQVAGGDGFGYEYIYKLTIDGQAPDVPNDHTNNENKDWEDFDFIPNNWTDNPGGVDSTWRWCWVCYRVKLNGAWSEFKGANGKTAEEGGKAALYAHYGKDGDAASSASRDFMIFTWTGLNTNLDPATPFVPLKPEDNVAKWNISENTLDLNPDQTWNWSFGGASGVWSVNPGNEQNKYLWMSTATFSQDRDGEIVNHWSDPVCLTGNDGRNGTDGIDTAFGYHLCVSDAEFATLTAPVLQDTHEPDSFVLSSGWTDNPQGISQSHPIEAASVGSYNKETDTWSYGTPFIWAKWGEDGIDGDGIEYLFFVATEEDVVKSDILDSGNNKIGENIELKVSHWLPITKEQLEEFLENDEEKLNTYYHDRFNEWVPSGTGWTDDPSDVGPFQPYEFVVIRKYQYNKDTKEGKWGYFSEPALWAKYGKDGEAGRSVFTSFAFTRTIKNLATLLPSPQGGSVENPVPDSVVLDEGTANEETIIWTDSIPSNNNAPVWMTSRIFDDSLTGEGTGWKTPTKLQDSPNFQVEYTDEEVWNTAALPSLNDYVDWTNFPEEGIDEPTWRQAALEATNAKWGDIGEGQNDIVDPWWMITARRSNGRWSSWAIHKIKGEKGEPGTSISVKGSFDSYKDLGDLNGDPAGQVNHSEVLEGDCYVIGGLLWIYDDNSTKSSPYSTDYVTDPEGNGQVLGDRYAGFSCQGQFKGDPGESSWIHVRFANESEATGEELQTLIDSGFVCEFNGIYIEFTGSSHLGNVPGKYAGIAITHDVNIAPTNINAYAWSEWKGDDIYGTEQIFTLSTEVPEKPTRPNDVDEKTWNTHDYVPSGWSDTPLSPTPDEHCWVTTRRLSDPEDKTWKTPVIYTRYAKDGNDGIDGAVNEFAYHLGDINLEPGKDLSKARKYENHEPSDTKTSGIDASWWESDESRDYCPADLNNGYWTDNPQGVSDEDGKRVEYYIYRTREYDDANNKYVWTSWSPIKIWSSWGQKGRDGDGIEYIFTLTETFDTPENPTPSDKTVEVDGKKWEDYDFAPKVAIAGTDPVEYQVWADDPQEVGSTLRYQWVSMRRSHSVDPDSAPVWSEFSDVVLWNMYTEDGKDGRTEEFVYFLTGYDSNGDPIVPTLDSTRAYKIVSGVSDIRTGLDLEGWQELEDYLPALGNPEAFGNRFDPTQYENIWWSDNPLAISESFPLEYQSRRFKKDGIWSEWSSPIPWSTWGKTGQDGDGVEYIFTRTANKDVVPDLTVASAFEDYNGKSWTDDDFVPEGWTDDPQGVTKDLRVEWVSIRKTFEGEWPASGDHKRWSDPKIWKEFDDSILEERVYHYGGKTDDPVLNQIWNFKGQKVNSNGESLQQLDGFIPSDVASDANIAPGSYYEGNEDYDPEGWTPFIKGITSDNRYEYEAIRKKNPETGVWGEFRVSRYAAWGEDGDSVEFVFWMLTSDQHSIVQTTHQNGGLIEPYGVADDNYNGGVHNPSEAEYLPQISIGSSDLRAQDDPSDLTSEKPYLYASKRTKRNGSWGAFCDIFLYSQLVLEPEYSCTLDLEEDTQGVSVEEVPIEGSTETKFRALKSSVSIGLTDMELRYGASAMIVGKVWVAPLIWNKTENKYQRGTDVLVWDVTENDGASTTVNINIPTYVGSSDINVIRFSVNRADTFYNAWFSWSASNLVFDKDSDGNPRDINFIIRAGGSTTEGETNKTGEATFKIRPSVGDTVYEISPWYNLFKKGTTGDNPFDRQSLSFYLYKDQVGIGRSWMNKTDWDTNGNLSIRYKVDQLEVSDSSATWVTASGITFGENTEIKESNGDDNKWTFKENIYREGMPDEEPYILFTIFLYKSVSGTKTSLIGDPVDGITIQILNDGEMVDEEYIPVVYNGKDGKRGDYYKEETAYYLSQSDQIPSVPTSDVTLVTPSGTDSNDAEKWLNAAISPTATYRYLYAVKRLNRYWGDNDSERDVAVDTISVAGTWDTPFLFASRSVGIQGDAGRGISGRTEYYQWTSTNSAPSKTPRTNWTEGSVPAASENDKFLWNFEVINYTVAPLEEETAVELVGSVSEDGRSITGLTEYYLWSGSNSGITINGNTWYEADELPSPTGNQIYLWNYEEVSYDKEPTLVQTDPVVIAVNGKSISSVTEYYKWTATEGEKPSNSSTTGWTANTIPASSTVQGAKYLWNFESVSYNYGAETKTPVALLTTLVEDGRGISGIDEYYIWWNSGTNVPAKTATGWYQSNNPGSPTEDNRYLWNYEVIHFDDNSADLETDPVLLSQNGTNGTVGNGVESIDEYYLWTSGKTLSTAQQNHANATPVGSSWSKNSIPGEDETKPYLWNFEIITYTEGDPVRTSPAIISSLGKGIKTIVEKYQWSDKDGSAGNSLTSSQGTWYGTDDMSGLASQASESYKYLWNYEEITYSDNTTENSTPIIISIRGDKGDDGPYSQFVYFRSKNELTSSFTLISQSTSGAWTTNSDSTSLVEYFPCWRYGTGTGSSAKYISANTSGTYAYDSSQFGIITDDPQGVNDDWRYEYESMGTNDGTSWTFSTPSLHNYKAADGESGRTRVELFKVTTTNLGTAPSITSPSTRSAQTSAGWLPFAGAVTDDAISGASDYDIWIIYTTYAADGSEDDDSKEWIGPVLYNSIRKGDSGLAGAVVRGPVNWEDAASGRLWNSGDTEEENGIRYIDVVVYDDHYYRCKASHSHTGSTSDVYVPGRTNSGYWTNADGEYEFIATDLLLATNAKIKFLSGNQLVLTYDNNGTETISGGAVGGTGVNFWSGGTGPNDSNNKFTVDYQGNLTSTAGTIGGWTIGENSLSANGGYPGQVYSVEPTDSPEIKLTYYGRSAGNKGSVDTWNNETLLRNDGLYGEWGGTYYDGPTPYGTNTTTSYSGELSLTSRGLEFSDYRGDNYSHSRVGNGVFDAWNNNGTVTLSVETGLSISNNSSTLVQLNASNGNITGAGQLQMSGNIIAEGNMVAENGTVYANKVKIYDDPQHPSGTFNNSGPNSAVSSYGCLPLKIAIVISYSDKDTLFTKSGGYWYFNGASTEVSSTDYPTLSEAGGEFYFSGSNGNIYPGVLDKDSTYFTRRGDTIYIEI